MLTVEGSHELSGTALNGDFIRQVMQETFDIKEYSVLQ